MNAATGRGVAALDPLKTLIRLLVFSPDGRTLAARCMDNTVVLFDIAARQQVGSLPAPKADLPQADIAFSPDGKVLAIAGQYDGSVKLWDIATRRVVSSYASQSFVVFSPDGHTLVTKTDETDELFGAVALWDIASGRKRLVLRTPNQRPICATFSPDSRRLAVGLGDGTIRVYETDTGRALKAPKGHRSWVYSVAFSPDGKRLASASTDSTIRLWETATGREQRTLRGHQGEVESIAFSPDGKMLVSDCQDSTVKLWDAAPETGEDSVRGAGAALSHDGRTLATASESREQVTLRDTDTLRITSIIPQRVKTLMVPLGFSRDGKIVYLAVGNRARPNESRIALWDIAARRQTGSIAANGFEYSICWLSPDGTLLVGGNWYAGRPLRILDLANRRELKPFKGRADGRMAAFSADGRWLGVARQDNTFRVWDTRTWKAVSPALRVAIPSDGALAFSPDGRLLLTGSRMGRVDVWDTASWTRKTFFQAHSGFVKNVGFSPDGKTVITRESGSVAKLWNTTTWRQTLTLKSGDVLRTQFTPDGNTLVTSGDTTRIWRAASLAQADARRRSSAAPGIAPPPTNRTPKQNATTTAIQKAP